MRINKTIIGKIALGMIAAAVITAASLFNVIMVTSPPGGPPDDEFQQNGTVPDPKIVPIGTDLEMTASSQLIACNYQNGVIIEAI